MDAFFAEFLPALPEWPLSAQIGRVVVSHSQVTAFEFDGVPFASGTCQRSVRAAGFEPVVADGKIYPDALRMEADTELAFGWLASIKIHEDVWFVRELGPVRREDHYQGRALWLFRFQSDSRYELVDSSDSDRLPATLTSNRATSKDAAGETQLESTVTRDGPVHKGLVSRVAICFERAGRRIRMSGLAFEWEANTPAEGASR